MWVDAELPTPLGSIVSTSSYFAYDAVAPPEPATDVVGTAWGWTRDAEGVRVDGAVRIPGQPPTATVTDGVLVLAAPDAPPSLLYGQPVTSAADYVRFASADAVPGDGGYLVVNRVDGEDSAAVHGEGRHRDRGGGRRRPRGARRAAAR